MYAYMVGLHHHVPSQKTTCRQPEVFLFLSVSKAAWRRRYANQYVCGALVERYRRGKAEVSQESKTCPISTMSTKYPT